MIQLILHLVGDYITQTDWMAKNKTKNSLAAEMAGLRFEDCLAAAYDEIKGRTGSMVGGVFVKNR